MTNSRLSLNMEQVRCELEQGFFPPLGLPLDIAAMVAPLDSVQDVGLSRLEPPARFRAIYNPRLMAYQWERLVSLVRDPVQVMYTRQGLPAYQVLGQFVLFYLPNGQRHTWEWSCSLEEGMHLSHSTHIAIADESADPDDAWLLQLCVMATLEVRRYVCIEEARARAYGAWVFAIFRKLLAEHADLPWMHRRIQHTLNRHRASVVHSRSNCPKEDQS